MAGAYQTSGFAYQGAGQFAYQGASSPTPTPDSGGGGGGGYIWPGRRKGKSKQERLFANLEKTIRNLVMPEVHIGTEHVILPEKVADIRVEKALRELSEIVAKDSDFAYRYSQLKREMAAYKEMRRQREIDDDDDDFFLLSE